MQHHEKISNISVLANSWNKLRKNKKVNTEYERFEATDFCRILHAGGKVAISIDDVSDWLDEPHLDPGYEVLNQADIVASAMGEDEESISNDKEMIVPELKLSTLQTYVDALINYSSYSQLMAHHYQNLRMVRELIIKEQHIGDYQIKISNFLLLIVQLKTVGSSNNATPVNSHYSTLKIENDENHPTMIVCNSDQPIIILDSKSN